MRIDPGFFVKRGLEFVATSEDYDLAQVMMDCKYEKSWNEKIYPVAGGQQFPISYTLF